MILKTAYYNSGTSTHAALAAEANFLSYSLNHEFNAPATATIILADPTGSISQKYDVDTNAVYVGPGRAYIEDPDATCIFDGRILKARHDTVNGRVILLCQDWLSQLGEERIDYDMREDLGGGVRQSTIHAAPRGNRLPVYTNGADYYMYDDAMSWAKDEFDGKHLVFPNAMVGKRSFSVGPSVYNDNGAGYDTDEFTVGLGDLWKDDANKHTIADNALGLVCDYKFPVFATKGAFYKADSITGARYTITYSLECTGGDDTTYVLWYSDAGTVHPLGKIPAGTGGDLVTNTYEVQTTRLAGLTDANGYAYLGWVGSFTPPAVITLKLHYASLEVDIVTEDGYSTTITIEDTDVLGITLSGAVADDGGAETDETTEANSAAAGDMTLLPAMPVAVGDAYYFGFDVPGQGIDITIDTTGQGNYAITWKYSTGGDTWASFSGVTDGTDSFRTAGTPACTWTIPSAWATDTVGAITGLYWAKAELTADVSLSRSPIGTQAWLHRGNRIEVDVDLTIANADAGFWEECPYCFVQEIYKSIASDESPGNLITGGDDLMPLTCAGTIEHTSGMTTRHYTDRSRLEILKDLANIDKAVFWVTLGGVIVTWKSEFAGGVTEITDASVLSWSGGEYDYEPMRNEYNIYGVRIGDNQLFVNTGTLTPDPGVDSKAKYGVTRSDTIKSSGTMSIYETESLGKAIVERDEDVLLLLRAVVVGRTALRLGEELNINSTLLGLTDKKYVITHWSYDSTMHRTTLRMHPRTSEQGYISHITFGEHIRHIADTAKQAQLDTHSPDLYTQTWD